ncbi:GDP-mannose-dependent alpha-(1-6)-phosphatidylinositol monomannoside mannosyltransferase [bacterium MnTg03]|nr:GDP-mannose-dependent alpha-(1-6)-phosphatidylinositol monomannoside mannosyltransferase [bacterium MnTg03]
MTTVGFVLKGYPRLSETFIAQEILALEKRGLEIQIISLRHPTDKYLHPVHDEISAPVNYLPEYLHDEPIRVAQACWNARRLPGYQKAAELWRGDLARDISRNRIRRFGQACVLAVELPEEIEQLHAHFLHTPASVARYASIMLGMPWSCSAHAKDIYTSPQWELREKLADCQWLVTCTATNAAYLSKLAPSENIVSLVYHGLDFDSFVPPDERSDHPDGSSPLNSVTILSVGRAVEKKGYDGLLRALSQIPDNLHWRFVHIGGGLLIKKLMALSRTLGIESNIDWRGALPQDQVLSAYREAHIFVLNSRIASDGDRDGLPNVLMEAQSQQLACVATGISAIPELIIDGETGILVPPDSPETLSRAISKVIEDPTLRQSLGKAGEQRVRNSFALDAGINDLSKRFDIAGDG